MYCSKQVSSSKVLWSFLNTHALREIYTRQHDRSLSTTRISLLVPITIMPHGGFPEYWSTESERAADSDASISTRLIRI